MKRRILQDLIAWKDSISKKPLILKGARQTGKTYILKYFGEHYYQDYHYFNFEKDSGLHTIFQKDLNPERILNELSLYQEKLIQVDNDLVIFDEIQECPRALTSLKYFHEHLPGRSICAAGSLLGLQLGNVSFPVGKVKFLHLYPMTFEEYLWALDNHMLLDAYYEGMEKQETSTAAHMMLLEKLFGYFVTGGMPEIVAEYGVHKGGLEQSSFQKIREFHSDLITMYESDVAKHAGSINAMHIVSVLQNIPRQLAGAKDLTTSRYRFTGVIPGKKGFSALQGPIQWLESASLILKIGIANHAEIPLKAFTSDNMFKCFLFDIGLLGSMLNIPSRDLLLQDYGIAKGFFGENYVLQELTAAGHHLVSWKERNSEIEFIYQDRNGRIIPIEVKSGTRTQAKSLKQFCSKYSPETAVIVSARPLDIKRKSLVYIPLYYAGKIPELIAL